MLKRYQQLDLRTAITSRRDYSEACKELAEVLRGAYKKSPKNLQALMFQDTVVAFDILLEVGRTEDLSAAYPLCQAAEASFPKQKKGRVITKFKHAAVAARRRSKDFQGQKELGELPYDSLIHVFGYLDILSLLSASSLCSVWNQAARENTLWQAHYALHFGEDSLVDASRNCGKLRNENHGCCKDTEDEYWYQAFKKKYTSNPTQLLRSNRAFCNMCKSPIWFDNRCALLNEARLKNGHPHIPRVLQRFKVLDFLLDKSDDSSSDSDYVVGFFDFRRAILDPRDLDFLDNPANSDDSSSDSDYDGFFDLRGALCEISNGDCNPE